MDGARRLREDPPRPASPMVHEPSPSRSFEVWRNRHAARAISPRPRSDDMPDQTSSTLAKEFICKAGFKQYADSIIAVNRQFQSGPRTRLYEGA